MIWTASAIGFISALRWYSQSLWLRDSLLDQPFFRRFVIGADEKYFLHGASSGVEAF
jgi:hypothetical protein